MRAYDFTSGVPIFINGAATAAFTSIVNEAANGGFTSGKNHKDLKTPQPEYEAPGVSAEHEAAMSEVAMVDEAKIAPATVARGAPSSSAGKTVPTASSGPIRGRVPLSTAASSPVSGVASGSSFSNAQLAGGLIAADPLPNQVLLGVTAPVAIALAPGAAVVGASVGAAIDLHTGSPVTVGSVLIDATISSAVAPIGYARHAGNHPFAKGTDFIRTSSAGYGIEAAAF